MTRGIERVGGEAEANVAAWRELVWMKNDVSWGVGRLSYKVKGCGVRENKGRHVAAGNADVVILLKLRNSTLNQHCIHFSMEHKSSFMMRNVRQIRLFAINSTLI